MLVLLPVLPVLLVLLLEDQIMRRKCLLYLLVLYNHLQMLLLRKCLMLLVLLLLLQIHLLLEVLVRNFLCHQSQVLHLGHLVLGRMLMGRMLMGRMLNLLLGFLVMELLHLQRFQMVLEIRQINLVLKKMH
jgi:hypothetical protein